MMPQNHEFNPDHTDQRTTSAVSQKHDLCQKARVALHRSVIHALHQLEVDHDQESLIVTGKVESYYHKQMAQETIRAEMPTMPLINSVEVEQR